MGVQAEQLVTVPSSSGIVGPSEIHSVAELLIHHGHQATAGGSKPIHDLRGRLMSPPKKSHNRRPLCAHRVPATPRTRLLQSGHVRICPLRPNVLRAFFRGSRRLCSACSMHMHMCKQVLDDPLYKLDQSRRNAGPARVKTGLYNQSLRDLVEAWHICNVVLVPHVVKFRLGSTSAVAILQGAGCRLVGPPLTPGRRRPNDLQRAFKAPLHCGDRGDARKPPVVVPDHDNRLELQERSLIA